jgi:DNA-binding transcriptional LysR family regulator
MLAEATMGIDAISQLQAVPRGTVRVSCVPNASRVLLAPILPRFLQQYPEVRVEVQVTNRIVDLYEDGVDVALRVQADIQESGSVVVRPLWKGAMHIVAAPSLLCDVSPPVCLEDLARFPTLDRTEPQGRHVWMLRTPDGRPVEFAHNPRLVSDDLETLLQAALAGIGIAKLSELMCGSAIAAGKLRPLLSDWTIPPHELYAIFLSRRGLLPAVRQFINFLAESLHVAQNQT